MAEPAKLILRWAIIDFIVAVIFVILNWVFNKNNILTLIGFSILGLSALFKPLFKGLR